MSKRSNPPSPDIHPDAWVADNAMVSGNVTIGAGSRILHGAQVIAEGGKITIGRECIVLQNAVLRSTARHDLVIGNNCLVGPNAHVAGCVIEDEVFVATGAAIFHAARLETGCEVRINGVVHVKSRLQAGKTVPIGWIAVGDPAEVLPPQEHERIWAIQEPLCFPDTVYGLTRAEATMTRITRRLSAIYGPAGADTKFDDN